MTLTDEIRAKLDERGIKYTTDDSNDYEIVEWQGPYNLWWQFLYDPYEEAPYGEIRLMDVGTATHIRPEQAIAVTLGAGTCKLVDNDSGPDMHCTACGGGVDDEYRYFMDSWGYSRCPHCGARIIEEETE